MKYIYNVKNIAVLLTVIMISSTILFAQSSKEISDTYVPQQAIVQLQYGKKVDDLIKQFPINYNLHVIQNLSIDLGLWLVGFDETNISDNQLLNLLRSNNMIKAAQFNHYIKERVLEPNDPSYVDGTQWSMNNTGQNGGLDDADIDAPEAWEISTGGLTATGDTIVVAVIDGGFSLSHEDITFWKNYAEIPANGVDDDNNGYVDDVNGWNAGNNNGTIGSSSHGTHVSGTVGAIGNNNIGVVGVNWHVKVMPIVGSTSQESVAIIAYSYAYKQRKIYNNTNGTEGAFVVSTNSSFGVNNGNPNNYPIWCSMYDSLGSVGILSAGATANANYNIDVTGDIPTACTSDFLIAVTNTTKTDIKSTQAGYGLTTIDLGAPGTSIISTYPNNTYSSISGTSMATPHVAGAVALMISAGSVQFMQDYKNNPDSVALIIKQMMLDNVDTIAAMQGVTVSDGRLNLFKSLQAVLAYSPLSTAIAKNTKSRESTFYLANNPTSSYAELFYALPNNGMASIIITDLTGKQVLSIDKTNSSQGNHNNLINVESLNAGIYFVQLHQNNQLLGIQKLIKK